MGIVSAIVVFLIIWWTALFCVLPWGNRPDENPDVANAKSAPANPRIMRKFLITTLLTCVLWLIVYGLIQSDVISFHDMAHDLAKKEHIQ
jgi:predicted secreted protein